MWQKLLPAYAGTILLAGVILLGWVILNLTNPDMATKHEQDVQLDRSVNDSIKKIKQAVHDGYPGHAREYLKRLHGDIEYYIQHTEKNTND